MQRYLALVNDPERFARRFGLKGPDVVWYLRLVSLSTKDQIEHRTAVVRAVESARGLVPRVEAALKTDVQVADALVDLTKTERGEGRLRRILAEGQTGARMPSDRDLELLTSNDITANQPVSTPIEIQAAFDRLGRIWPAVFKPGDTLGKMKARVRRAKRTLAPLLPSDEQIARLIPRLKECRLPECRRVFLPQERAQQYCLGHLGWSKQRRWYESRGRQRLIDRRVLKGIRKLARR